MHRMDSHKQHLLELARRGQIIRSRELKAEGIPRVTLTRLVREGHLERVGNGLYSLPNMQVSEHTALAQVAKKCPRGIICLLSALRVHDLTTQSPHEVWLAIPGKARPPKLEYPALRIVRFSGQALTEGIVEHEFDGIGVRVTNIPKTVADCFKYRNKVGLDVALEALQEAHRSRRMEIDELWYFAKICRVARIMRPYIESLTA
jgi:predicted transcriptional regulator of viral defense system